MSFVIAPIVEGHGDVDAVPLLIRRLDPMLVVKRPVRFPRSRLVIDEHLSRAAYIAASNIVDRGAILLVIDADEDCAATLGPAFEQRLSRILPKLTCRAVMPVREFESWIVGGESRFEIENADVSGDPKGRLRRLHDVYKETADQARLMARADIELLSNRSRSFRRFLKIVNELSTLSTQE